MPERERLICRTEQKAESPLFSREPLIELPDRNISLVYTRHGEPTQPFPGLEVTEKEISDVFGKNIDALSPDSFPANIDGVGGVLKPATIAKSLVYPIQKLPFVYWPARYAIEKDITIIGADPYSRSERLRELIKDEDEDFPTYVQEKYIYNRGKFSPEYKNLEFRTDIIATLRSGFDFFYIFQFLTTIKKLTELKLEPVLERREFMKWMFRVSALYFSTSARDSLQKGAEFLSTKKDEFLKTYEEKHDIDDEIREDTEAAIKLFFKGIELSEKDFDEPALERRIFLNEHRLAHAGLRNALVAETLTLPVNEILPWTAPKPKVNIVATYGFDHRMVPKEMRIDYFIKNEEARKDYIKRMVGFLVGKYFSGPNVEFFEGLKRELAEGISYKIKKDGGHFEHKFKI